MMENERTKTAKQINRLLVDAFTAAVSGEYERIRELIEDVRVLVEHIERLPTWQDRLAADPSEEIACLKDLP